MNAFEVAERLAAGGRIQDLSGQTRHTGGNRLFRLWSDADSRILKVYGTAARDRRERHALEALEGIDGIPTVIDRGTDGELVWTIFADAGQWNLASLPENPGLARRAGEVLRSVHESAPNPMSNLARGIDQEWVAVDFASTFKRLERFRRRVGVSSDLLDAARGVQPPHASEPVASHTDATPENFLVNDNGNVTLVNWEWATLAPPEWDLSKVVWQIAIQAGPSAATAIQDGYGQTLDPDQLDRWIVYHVGMTMVFQAEQQVSTGSADDYADLVAELQRAVTGSSSSPAPAGDAV